MRNADMPAMPQSAKEDGYGCNYGDGINQVPTGLTKREMFAMHAMQGLLSSNVTFASSATYNHRSQAKDQLAKDAVFYADALLAELEK